MIELEEFAVPPQLEGDTWTFTDHVYASSLPRRNISCVRQLLDESECATIRSRLNFRFCYFRFCYLRFTLANYLADEIVNHEIVPFFQT